MVDDTFFLRVIQSSAKLLGDGQNFAELRLALRHHLFQSLAFHKLRGHEDGESLVAAGMKLGDIGMVEGAGGTGFSKNPLEQLLDVVQPFRNFKLAQGHHAVRLGVLGLVDDPDASAGHFLDQLQTVSPRSSCGGWSSGVFHGLWHWWRTMASAWERTSESYLKDGLRVVLKCTTHRLRR